MRQEPARSDRLVAKIGARQHGVVSVDQPLAAGLSASGITRRLRSARLHRVHRGVYAVGHHGLGSKGRWLAAVLACGDGAVLNHLSAAGLWELLPPLLAPVHVTIPTDAGRAARPGIRLHRSPYLPNGATTHHHRIAVTTPARTLLDLRRTISPGEYRQALREAAYRNLDLGDLEHDGTRSEPERLFLRLCRRHRLPAPEPNQPIGRYTVDFLWREERLIVETDAWSSHRGSQAFEDDHERDLDLRVRGYRVRRFTRRQLEHHPRAVAASVRAALSR